MSGLIFGIDIGGTFTDVVAYDEADGTVHVAKVPSTPPRLAEGFIAGIKRILDDLGRSPGDVTRVVHGTTIGTNAVLEHRGATLGILTTAGFEDVLTIGRMKRSDMYDLEADPEVPLFLAPRRRIRGIPERLDSRGEVLTPLDADAVRHAVTELVEREGVESVVVCYLFSYLRADHEQQTREIVRERYPSLHVSLSSEVDAKFREYERLVMTAFDAYIRPIIQDYLRALDGDLRDEGIAAPLQVMQSRGAISGAWVVVERPVTTVLSGPAAGVIGGIDAARRSGFDDAVTIDIGGTSCDVALVRGAKPVITTEGRIERFPLRLPMIDVHTIGAGGGSIAWVDAAGGLKVGPRSAGSRPGPAAYAQGGTQATVTDASVVLGYLNPENFAGGTMALRPELAERAIAEHVAGPLGLDVPAAAAGVHRIVNSGMAQAVRLVSVRRGHDPRRLALVALGGAGPVHAGRLARAIGIPTVVVPPTPGVLSALGLLLADVEHEFSRTCRSPTGEADPADLAAVFSELDAACEDRMRREGVASAEVAHFAELRYVRQSYELEVPLPTGPLTRGAIDAAAAELHRQHERVYGFCLPNAVVELVTLRTVHTARLVKPELSQMAAAGAARAADPVGSRAAYFEEAGRHEPVPVYDRTSLGIGQEIVGPAILEQRDTTTVVYPGQSVRVDQTANLILTTGTAVESANGRPRAPQTLGAPAQA
jgi:N-methylhydantoinase A/oxoprolinase/acetone carboxylase beta subunit